MTEEKKKDILSAPAYDEKKPPVLGTEVSEEAKKKMDATRARLEKFKKEAIKKYPLILAIGIIPPQAADKFDEEMGLTEEEEKEKPMHLTVLIPEDNFKEIGKIRAELVKMSEGIKPKLWLNVITPVDLWNYCIDSKFDVIEAVGMSFPLHDKGLLSGLRVAQIHKSLVLRRFEKYIYSYIIGGSLVRGGALKTSDVDTFIIIDDTDVKRMPRVELKEKLRSIIYQQIAEASELAGVKNLLNVQVYLLTEFWESVKDAHPVMFTVIRDGVPLYDRGGFLPWKLLLKMGKIKPSPEAIDMFMSMGDKTKELVQRRLLDIVMGDIYWGVISPSQALLMLYGVPPPNVSETVSEMKRVFLDKEKMIEKKYIDILEEIIIKYYKGYEHGKIKEVSGAEVDKLLKNSLDYMKRLKELREQIEDRTKERTIKETHENIFKILKHLFGAKSESALVKDFEEELVKKGRIDPKYQHVLNELISAKKKYKNKKKPTTYEVEDIRKNAAYLINSLIEYGQRCELAEIRKMQVRVSYGDDMNKHTDLFLTNPAFLISEGVLKKVTEKGVEPGNQEEFDQVLSTQKGKPSKLTPKLMAVLKKELGEFEVGI